VIPTNIFQHRLEYCHPSDNSFS